MILYNPHVDDFLAEPLQFRILKRRPLKKYGFLFDELRARSALVKVLVDGTSSGLIPEKIFHTLPNWLRQILASIEFRLWKYINGLEFEVVRVQIPTEFCDEVLVAFSYKAATGRFNLREVTFNHYRAVIFHLTHYFLATSEKAGHIRRISNAYLAGDSDITGNSYFEKYFSWYKKPFLVLPFAVSKRFICKNDWLSRDARIVATGSFHDLRLEKPLRKYIDFMRATGATTYHPVRLAIFQASEYLTPWVTSIISPYRKYGQNLRSRMFAHFRVSQKEYFSIDIVDVYNQHRYAVVGEELTGFPALGALEAMACGCVLFAQADYYRGLGFEPGIHFLHYDGSLAELIARLEVVKEHQAISESATRDVRDRFAAGSVFTRWQTTIEELVV